MQLIQKARQIRNQIYLLTCTFMLAVVSNAHAGPFDAVKSIALSISEPVGIVVIMIGGMRISNKDIYAGIAAIVGGIFIFKAQDIASALK